MTPWLGAFRVWFQAQPLSVKRAAIRERLDAYMADPLMDDVREACPPAVRCAYDDFKVAVRTENWTVIS